MFTFKSLHEFNDRFKDEKTCLAFYEQVRWGGKPVCPHCGSEKVYTAKTRSRRPELQGTTSYRCADRTCDKAFTATVGSIFENTKISLRTWFLAIYFISADKKGISSINLADKLGVTQKTAWFMLHRMREMLKSTEPTMISEDVQADETYIGGKNKNRHANKKTEGGQGGSDKTPVLGLMEKGGKVTTFVITNTGKTTLQHFIKANVAEGDVLVTDEHKGYMGLSSLYKHHKVNHSAGNYVTTEGFHTNGIENYWSILKRGIIGIYHQVSPYHLHRYCDEFSYRYNNRKESLSSKFNFALSSCASARITYRTLIGR